MLSRSLRTRSIVVVANILHSLRGSTAALLGRGDCVAPQRKDVDDLARLVKGRSSSFQKINHLPFEYEIAC
ncbi:hypothetical protein BR93DRAFT_932002 [Coniochaeta sp. PMI_546]|nr:hypothetical protein BR93DRAFT_932002 [Coniochaeta sp. PMI_546]